MSKLPGQIAFVQRLIAEHDGVAPRLVSAQRMSQEQADAHAASLQGVASTLRWLRENEADVRAFVAERQEARAARAEVEAKEAHP